MGLKYNTTADIKVSKKIVDQIIGQEEAINLVKKASSQRRNLLLIGDPGTGKCISSDAEIVLSDGSTLAAEQLFNQVRAGMPIQVQSVNPCLTLSISKILRAETTMQNTIEITTNAGKKIKVSREHPFLALDKNGISWKNSGELKLGSYIAAPRLLESADCIQRLENSGKRRYAPLPCYSNVKEINIPGAVTPELAEFLGYLWSEGYISRKKSITFTNSELCLIERFEFLAAELFCLTARREYHSDKNAYVSILESVTLAMFLYDFGWKSHIPPKIISSPLGVVASFLRAYFDGDGSATKRNFEVVCKERKVISDMQTLLLRFGIVSLLKSKFKKATNSKMVPKLYHSLIIYDTENLEKLKAIGFTLNYKNERLETLCKRNPHSNLDKIPHIGHIIFATKEKLRLTSEEIGMGVHQFSRYLQGTRVPTRKTVQKIVTVFSQRFLAIKSLAPQITDYGIQDMQQVCSELRISTRSLAMGLEIGEYTVNGLIEVGDSRLVPAIQQVMSGMSSIEVENSILRLYQLAFSDVMWERVISIKEGEQEVLYDFEAEGTHNFIANNIIVHNSMIGQAMAELLPHEKLVDVLSFINPTDDNVPLIRTMPRGQGRDFVTKAKIQAMGSFKNQNILLFIFILIASFLPYYFYSRKIFPFDNPIIYAASMITSIVVIIGFMLFLNLNKRMGGQNNPQIAVPKMIIDNADTKKSPFIDATGAHAGALLGDVLHDPLQSFLSSNKIFIVPETGNSTKQIQEEELSFIDELLNKHKKEIIHNGEYEAAFLEKDEINVLGEKNGNLSNFDVLSVNRYPRKGNLIKIISESGKELLVTPEHKVAVIGLFNKIKYIEAIQLKPWHKLVTLE